MSEFATKLVNGVAAEHISLADRGLQFGDGVFRTIKVIDGTPIWWARHYAKLAADCERIGIVAPDAAVLLADLQLLAPTHHALKIIITRGETARGYVAPLDLQPNRIVQIAPLPAYSPQLRSEGVKLRICRTRVSWQPALAGIKHLNRLDNVLARREWKDTSVFDGLMLDRDDHVIEGVMSNVLAMMDGVLCTPDLTQSGVAGVSRDIAIAAGDQLGIPSAVCKITLAQLGQASAVWVCNSLAGLLPVRAIDQLSWPSMDRHQALIRAFEAIKE
ncbi:aminodeoxychorismate lyase [Chitinibacter bivalviorum]|uniref:aminodeoxychorismate lyase n=1 Tax=Chitinibacter bivalviorum TaxID=2739434 RepID=A0A7H9BIN9_9NEIS|nr:aminodeoxychorismate lyase [Chitinibacter bivalviorum]QLG88505.1 aminodeoxychorismate lyase [Chitinibacter bivalviorum]